ncbi:hypothetical protein [Novipirellula galeiformis]|uniref:hypothetical protein n=1 Tax=Novipirellula galeiformis TaxID=2528004 RepID=UPI001E40F3C7|nr:hypothetical protein [Novipirellula galeiformis]
MSELLVSISTHLTVSAICMMKTPRPQVSTRLTKPTAEPPQTMWQQYRAHVLSVAVLIVLGSIAIALLSSGGERRQAAEPMQIDNR